MDNIMGYEFDVGFDAVPYQEPADTDADSTAGGSVRSGKSSLGGRLSIEGGGGTEAGGGLGLGGMDVETGNMTNLMGTSLDQEPLEQELLQEEEKEILIVPSRLGDSVVKKRSSGSIT